MSVTIGRAWRALVGAAGVVVALASPGVTADGEAKGTLTYKGTTLALKHVYLIKGPDAVDPKKIIRRVILTRDDIGAKIRACQTMSCVDGAMTDGVQVDFDAGPRLNYWLTLNDGRVQYSGTARPDVLKGPATEPRQIAGKLSIDDTAGGGPRIDVEFVAPLLKEITAAR